MVWVVEEPMEGSFTFGEANRISVGLIAFENSLKICLVVLWLVEDIKY